MKNLLLIFTIAILASCQPSGPSHVKIHSYKQQSDVIDDDPMNDFIFWYVIMNNDGGCYYCQSTTPISNFSSVSWTQSQQLPQELNEPGVQETETQEAAVDELSEELQSEIDTTPEDFEGMTQDEMGDYEGGSEADSDGGGDVGGDSGGDGGGDGGGGE